MSDSNTEQHTHDSGRGADRATNGTPGLGGSRSPASPPISLLLRALKDLARAYVGLMETGRDRIVAMGGDCDPVGVMERGDSYLHKAREAIAAAESSQGEALESELTIADYEEVLGDHRRLVRELDLVLNGKGAAKQASLGDIVSQLQHVSFPWEQIQRDRDEWKRIATDRNVVIGALGQENERLTARVAELEAKLRTPALIDSTGYLADYQKAMTAFEVPQEPLQVYDSNSWRRVGLKARYKPVMGPIRLPDGHPDIDGVNTLRALVAAINAMPDTLAENRRLTDELRDHMWWERAAVTLESQRDELFAKLQAGPASSFQARVADWMDACFGPEIPKDCTERNHRFLEESLELVQAGGCSKSEVLQLVDYVYGRPVGVMSQEVGGVMVTLAALCGAFQLDMQRCAEDEITRVWICLPEIRAKQAGKPKFSALPESPAVTDHHRV